jgi:DNA-binding response OmpR family regulator
MRLKILLIEDEAKIADFVVKGLAGAGFVLSHVSDGEQGLQAMLQADHDLVLLELMLPKLNGYDVLRQARVQGNQT